MIMASCVTGHNAVAHQCKLVMECKYTDHSRCYHKGCSSSFTASFLLQVNNCHSLATALENLIEQVI